MSFGDIEGYETPEPVEIDLIDGDMKTVVGEYSETPIPPEEKPSLLPLALMGLPLLIPLLKKK